MGDLRFTHEGVRPRSAKWPLLGLLLAAAGCASLPPVPSAGGPRWLELTSEHSVLWTDEPQDQATRNSLRVEQHRQALCQLAFICATPTAPKLLVITLPDGSQFEQLYGADAAGVFAEQVSYEPLLVLPDRLGKNSRAQLTRALTFVLAQQSLGALPRWLHSGLASYFETTQLDGLGAVVVGEPVLRHLELLRSQPRPHVAELLTPLPEAATSPERPEHAAAAWLLVHYLMSERRADFEAFLGSLASAQPLATAFHEAFPELSPELLDGLLDRYAQSGNYLTQSKQLKQTPSAAPQVRALSDADVLALRAQVSALGPGNAARERALRQLALAQHSDADHVRAECLRNVLQPADPKTRTTRAQALAQAHPRDWRAWVYWADTHAADGCNEAALTQLQALAPDNAHTLALRARCELHAGKHAAAIELSRRAYSAYPISPRIIVGHARLLQRAGACEELERLAERGLGSETLQALAEADPLLSAHRPDTWGPCVTTAASGNSAPVQSQPY